MSYLGDYYDASGPCDVKGPMRANANRMIQELECWYVVSAMARIIMFVTKTRVMRTIEDVRLLHKDARVRTIPDIRKACNRHA